MESSNKNMNKEQKDTYRFWNYVKKRPSVGIAIASALVALGSAILNFLAYLTDKRYLAFWNISEDFIKINNIKTIYFVFALTLTGVFVVIFHLWSTKLFNAYYETVRVPKSIDVVLDIMRNDVKRYDKKIKKLCARLKKERSKAVDVSAKNKISKLENKTKEIELKNKKAKIRSSDIKKQARKFIRRDELRLFVMALTMTLLQAIINIVYFWIMDSSTNNVILPAFILAFLLVIPSCLIEKALCMKKIKSEAKKTFNEKGLDAIIEDEYQIEKTYQTRRRISDRAFKNICLYVSATFIIVMVVIYCFVTPNCRLKKEFYVFEDGSDKYVYVYENDSAYILEKAEINAKEKTIVIYATEQYFIQKSNVRFKFVKFEDVDYIKYK